MTDSGHILATLRHYRKIVGDAVRQRHCDTTTPIGVWGVAAQVVQQKMGCRTAATAVSVGEVVHVVCRLSHPEMNPNFERDTISCVIADFRGAAMVAQTVLIGLAAQARY